jgi:hypothetical protein
MTRTLTILVALAVSAAPASAGNSKKPPPRGTAGSTLIGEVTFPKARGAGVINSLGQGGNFGDTPGLGDGDMSVRRPATQKTKASGLKAGIPDGTSNTMMRSGSLKPLYGIIAILIG